MLTLLALALALRAVGAGLRAGPSVLARAPGWILSILGTWTAAGVAGIWFPLWIVLPIAAAGAVVEEATSDARWILAGDLGLLVLMARWATPPPEWGVLLVLVGGMAAAWAIIESWVRMTPGVVRGLTAGAAGAAVVVLAWRIHGPDADPLKPLGTILPHAAIAPACQGERVALEGGSVAWYDVPRTDGPHPGALVFHGAEPRGSRQPAACSLRRALVDAGFATLALDHPGYGESPSPPVDAPVDAWDPLPAQLEALEWLETRPEVRGAEILAGHSMGGTGAVRLLAERPEVPVTFLFGRGVGQGPERDEYWYGRFHTDRGLEGEVGMDRWLEIQERYVSFRNAAAVLPDHHGHVVFVTLGWEWDEVAETEEVAYDAIPGSKEIWHIPHSSHYFSAFSWHGLVVGDVRVARSLSAGIRRFVSAAMPGSAAGQDG